jgi:hypothetical protein
MNSAVLISQAAQTLRHSPIPALRRLTIEETETEIIISGSVASYYLKQLAQETVMPHLEQRRLVNRVSVGARNDEARNPNDERMTKP